MATKGMSGRQADMEEQWCFKVKELTREQMMEVVARCLEIAIRVVFENFTYNYGGKVYLQLEGGPIGASVRPLLNETKCHLVSFSLVANQTKWHLVWSFPN